MVEPVASHAGTDEPLRLAELDPDDLVDTGVAPLGKKLPAELQRASSDPEEQEALVLQLRDRQRAHHRIGHRSKGQAARGRGRERGH